MTYISFLVADEVTVVAVDVLPAVEAVNGFPELLRTAADEAVEVKLLVPSPNPI